MSADSAVSIAWDVFKIVFVPIKRQFEYVMCSKRYAEDLQEGVRNLEFEAARVRNAKEVARNNLQNIHGWVPDFLESAEKASEEAKDLLGKFEEAIKSCCRGTLPDPNCRYQFSRKAKHKIDEIKNLILKIRDEISCSGPPSGDVAAPTPDQRESKEVFQSRETMMRNIMAALADDTKSVVGIYGMGGVGKSTLLKDAEERIRAKKLFHWVAKADVSQNTDIKRIQGEIANALGLSDIENKEDVSKRATLLRRRLEKEEREKKKVLIILDNLWGRLDLAEVGIPCGPDNKARGCKLLLTARDRRVLLREMRCERDSAFLLVGLEKEESKRLFEKMAGGKVHEEEFKPLVEEALSICEGLPFLIVAISKLFIDTGYSECQDALKQIWNRETGVVITNTLQRSYGRISEEAKSLLRLCVAYGVSKPSLEYLARYGFGLGIFRGVSSMQEGRDRLGSLIHTLQASSLLLDGEKDADGFKIHDLVREFVASFASTDLPILVLKDKDKSVTEVSEDKLKSCEAICFPYVDLEELPEELVCPELRVFLLFRNTKSLEISDSYFNSTKNLMALHLTRIRLIRSPSPFQFLEKLHSLCLDYCSVEDVAILGKLKALQILSLRGSDIRRLPKEIGQLIELRLLDLSSCSQLKIIEPGVLGSLTKLEELYMERSFVQWSATEQTPPTKASLIELNNMQKLRTLDVSIRDPSVLPKDLDVEKLTKYKIRIGNVWRWSEHEGSRILELSLGSTSDVLRKECIQSILDKIDDLFLDGLDETEQSICAFSQKGFPQLKHLQVRNSPSLCYILKPPSSLAFNNISTESFSSLKVVRVESCDKMQALFPRSVMRELRQLEEIEVRGCNLMRGIVEADDDHGKFELPRLRVLKLHYLPIIENFVIARSSPSSSTPDDQVGTQIAFFNGQQVAFPRLETLEIYDCDNVGFMFSQSAVKSFPQLRKLSVHCCKKMEAIIMEEEGSGVEALETLAFSMLTDLHLAELESLTCFSREKCSREGRSQDGVQSYSSVLFNREVAFPSLEILEVNGSHNLKYMFFPSMVKSLTQLRELDVWNCEKMEAIIMEEEGSGVGISETPAFPMLTDLRLAELESLTCFSREKCSREGQSQDGVQSHSSAFFNRAVAFPNLQELKLDLSKRVWHGNFHDEESLCKLRVLELRHLSKECAISTCCFVESLTNLEELLVSESYLEDPTNNVEAIDRQCRELKVILPFSRRMQHLKTLDVSGSHGLSSMFTPTIAENLVALTKLRISNCRILTEVVSDEEFEEEQVVAFNQLKYMELEGLIELRCFSSSGYTLVFPLLEDVIVNKCPNMEFFSKGLIEAPKLERVKVDLKERYGPTTYQYFWKGNLNITIQNMCEEMASVAGLSFMQLFEFPELIEKWHCDLNPLKSSWQLKTLVVDKCPSFINAMPSKLMLVLEKMTSLQVRDCESLEEIFDLKGHEAVESTQVLPSLRNLSLINLPKLRQLWNKDLQGAMRFGSLSFLTLYKCSNLRYAFTPPMALCLANLQFMKIRECDQMEAVIEEEEGQGSMMEKITFLKLFSMELQCLPNLTSFLLGKDHVLDCPKINYLTIAHCPKMRSLTWQSSMDIDHSTPSLFTPQVQFPGLERMVLSHMDNLSKIWSNNPLETLTFDSLEKVEVQNCERLENLFPHWVTTSLTKLEKLQVESCRIEKIVANGDGTPHSDIAQVPFPKLTSLVLHDMPQLKTFCPNLPTLNWPFLKKWRVTHCDKVNMLSFAAYMNKRT